MYCLLIYTQFGKTSICPHPSRMFTCNIKFHEVCCLFCFLSKEAKIKDFFFFFLRVMEGDAWTLSQNSLQNQTYFKVPPILWKVNIEDTKAYTSKGRFLEMNMNWINYMITLEMINQGTKLSDPPLYNVYKLVCDRPPQRGCNVSKIFLWIKVHLMSPKIFIVHI